MEKVIQAAVRDFKSKLAKQAYLNMLDECFIDASEENESFITRLICRAEYYKYASGEISISFENSTYSCSTLSRLCELLIYDFDKEISYFSISATHKYSEHNTIITIHLNKEAIVEWYYMQKAKLKLDL